MEQSLAVDTDEVYERIVNGVAALEGVDPMALPPLFNAVDPDALTTVFTATASGIRRSGSIEFPYAGHQVRVTFADDGDAVVTID